MSDLNPWWMTLLVIIVLLVPVMAYWFLHFGKAVQVERARELFRLQHERYELALLDSGAATGLPRGLIWVSCLITGNAIIARDRASRAIVALVPVEIGFLPIPGSDMEEVPAAHVPRSATAVFRFEQGNWFATGRVVYNHSPEQTLTKFTSSYELVH